MSSSNSPSNTPEFFRVFRTGTNNHARYGWTGYINLTQNCPLARKLMDLHYHLIAHTQGQVDPLRFFRFSFELSNDVQNHAREIGEIRSCFESFSEEDWARMLNDPANWTVGRNITFTLDVNGIPVFLTVAHNPGSSGDFRLNVIHRIFMGSQCFQF